MKKYFIFLNSHRSSQAILLATDKQAIALRARELSLSAIANQINDGDVHLVLSDHMVSNYELNISAKNQNQLSKVARYAVEDNFPERLEEYHIVAQKNSNKGVSVRAILHSRFKELVARFTDLNIDLNHVMVESDLLRNNASTLLFSEDEVTFCGDKLEQTYEFDKAVAPILNEKIFSALGENTDLQIIYPESDSMLVESLFNTAPEHIRIKKIVRDERYYENLTLSNSNTVNLLQGEYKVAKDESEQNSFWKFPVYLGATSLMLLTGGLLAQNYFLGSKISTHETILSEHYVELFPNASKPRDAVDLSIKLKSKLKTANLQPQNDLPIDALNLLNLSSLAANGSNIELKALNIDKNAAEILVAGPSIEALNSFKEQLEKQSTGRSITMDSVTSVDDKYQGTLNVK